MTDKSNHIHPRDMEACHMLILDINAIESRAHRLGMTSTAHALNDAKNKAGWELAETFVAS